MDETRLAYTIKEAAALLSVSQDTIRRAVHATDASYLPAKNIGSPAKPRYRIGAKALEAWFENLPDA